VVYASVTFILQTGPKYYIYEYTEVTGYGVCDNGPSPDTESDRQGRKNKATYMQGLEYRQRQRGENRPIIKGDASRNTVRIRIEVYWLVS